MNRIKITQLFFFLCLLSLISGCFAGVEQSGEYKIEKDSLQKSDLISNKNDTSKISKPGQEKQKVSTLSSDKFEERMIDTIFNLKEVKDRGNYINKETQGNRYLKVWIVEKPDGDQQYYVVNAGEDNGSNLVTHFHFYVYPDPLRIMYYDVVNDQELSIDEWIKQSK